MKHIYRKINLFKGIDQNIIIYIHKIFQKKYIHRKIVIGHHIQYLHFLYSNNTSDSHIAFLKTRKG